VNFGQQVVLLLGVAHASQTFSQALTEVLRFDLIRVLAKGMSQFVGDREVQKPIEWKIPFGHEFEFPLGLEYQ
jgi:hypothetical protein